MFQTMELHDTGCDHEARKTEEDASSVFRVKYASMSIIELLPDL